LLHLINNRIFDCARKFSWIVLWRHCLRFLSFAFRSYFITVTDKKKKKIWIWAKKNNRRKTCPTPALPGSGLLLQLLKKTNNIYKKTGRYLAN
jgi:hypothetical protein